MAADPRIQNCERRGAVREVAVADGSVMYLQIRRDRSVKMVGDHLSRNDEHLYAVEAESCAHDLLVQVGCARCNVVRREARVL